MRKTMPIWNLKIGTKIIVSFRNSIANSKFEATIDYFKEIDGKHYANVIHGKSIEGNVDYPEGSTTLIPLSDVDRIVSNALYTMEDLKTMKKPRTLKELENHPLVADVWAEGNGDEDYMKPNGTWITVPDYWVNLIPGFCNDADGIHFFHEYGVAKTLSKFNGGIMQCGAGYCDCPLM